MVPAANQATGWAQALDLLSVSQQALLALQVRYDQDICTGIRNSTIQVSRTKTLDVLGNTLTLKDWGTLAWVESSNKVQTKVTHAVQQALQSNAYLQLVARAFSSVFQEDSPLKLSRFHTLLDELVDRVLPERVAKAKEDAQPTVTRMLQQAMMELDSGNPVLGKVFPKLDQGIKGCLMRHIIQQVKLRPLSLPEDFVLTEEAGVRAQRLQLHSKLVQLDTAAAKISDIENAISVSTPEPLSAATSSQPGQVPPPDYVDSAPAEQDSAPASGKAAPAATASVSSATVGNVASFTQAPAASATDDLQMHAVPVLQDSLGEEFRADFSAALLQSARDSGLNPPSAPASSSGTPMPESYNAQAPRSTSSPRLSQDQASAVETAGPARNMAFSMRADGEVDLAAPVQPASPHPSAAEIHADHDDQSRPESPTPSDSGSFFDVNNVVNDLPPSGQTRHWWGA